MNITKAILLPVLCGLLFIQPAAAVQMKDVPHPFLLWTREDITSMRGRMKSDPAFQKQIETYMVLEARSPKAGGRPLQICGSGRQSRRGRAEAGSLEIHQF
jgi:hypothetical protein